MQEIAHNVFIESSYPGVTLGAINLPRGLILIDAPPRFEDGRAWRAALQNTGGGGERLLVNLDSHYDRTLGSRAMECTVVAHEKTALVFRSRPAAFKAQSIESGADWERITGLGSIRWSPPELTFSGTMQIHWDGEPVILESHPGPNPGAIWVLYPAARVAFLGDMVTPAQPPFLGSADLPAWLEALKLLLAPEFRGWSLVSGRSSKLVTADQVRKQIAYLEEVQARTAVLGENKNPPEALEAAVQALLAASSSPAASREQYTQRLRWGLTHYLARKHKPSSNDEE